MYADESWYSPDIESIGQLVMMKGTVRASALEIDKSADGDVS